MKKTLLYILVLIFSLLAIVSLVVFKYAEEILTMKNSIYSRLSGEESITTELSDEYYNHAPFVHSSDAWHQKTDLVYHAGGGIDGLDYSNSKEAMLLAAENGTVLEVDFMYTQDGSLVCVHTWSDISASDTPITLEEFKHTRVYGRYTPMTAEDLIEFMSEHENIYIIIDTKEHNVVQLIQDLVNLGKTPDIIERFVIQLYEPGTKQQILDIYPFPNENFLLTCYKFTSEPNAVLNVCIEENISVVTVPYGLWDASVVDLFEAKEIVLFEHTVNRLDQVSTSKANGISKFYTDFLTESALLEATSISNP